MNVSELKKAVPELISYSVDSFYGYTIPFKEGRWDKHVTTGMGIILVYNLVTRFMDDDYLSDYFISFRKIGDDAYQLNVIMVNDSDKLEDGLDITISILYEIADMTIKDWVRNLRDTQIGLRAYERSLYLLRSQVKASSNLINDDVSSTSNGNED